MARKKGGASGAGAPAQAGGADDVKREQKLQALLLADAFMRTFRPITLEKPKVLLPLVNVSMLEYTIEFLALNGVQEIFVVSARHQDAVREFISSCKWPHTLTVHAVATPSCFTAGDALREVDAMGIIQSDPFVLVSGDVVSNMNLAAAIEFHKRCKKTDSNAIMTTVLQPLVKTARIRPIMDDLAVAIDGNTGQILMYDNKFTNEEVSIPLELYKEHHNVVFMDEMMDCQIDICSPEVLVKFSDNFDYQDIRRDMIINEVTNYELGGHIYSWTIRGEYAARVHDPRTYHAVCEDIIRRWLFPIVPESNFSFSQRTNYIQTKRYIYKDDATTARSAVVGRGCVLGAGTTLGDNCKVVSSTIGKNCTLGAGVTVKNSHIWDNVVIEDGAVLEHCIVCEGARIKRGATVSAGCVVSYNVVIGEGVVLPKHTRVSMFPTDDEDELPKLSGAPFDTDLVGPDGKGYRWRGETGADFDYVAEPEQAEELGLNMDRARLAACTAEEQWKAQLWSKVPEPQEEEASSIEFDEDEALRLFIRTIKEQMLTAHADNSSADNVLMEIRGYKFAQNREFGDCLQGVIGGLLELADCTQADLKFVGSFQQVVQKWKPVLTNLTVQPEDEQAIIEGVEKFWLEPEPKASKFPLFRIILQVLYKLDIVSHDALLEWVERRRALDDEDANLKALFNHPGTQELVAWLEEEEEEDDEEDDDDDDDEEN